MSRDTITIMKKVAIIGAGIAGLTCASELQCRGVQVEVFEKSRGPGGRSSTKRWDQTSGIGIDMGVPYIVKAQTKPLAVSVITSLLDAGAICEWRVNQKLNGQVESFDAYVGIPRMTAVVSALSNGLTLHRQARVTGISYNETWSLFTESSSYHHFDAVVLAIPAPQVILIEGVDDAIVNAAQSIQFSATNTLMLEMQSPMWFDDIDIVQVNGPKILSIIADYRKPGRNRGRFTYAVHSQPGWATNQFDTQSPDHILDDMLTDALTTTNRSTRLVMHAKLHRWKYAYLNGPAESLQCGYIRSTQSPLFACGDWCQGHTIANAFESGYLLAHNMLL